MEKLLNLNNIKKTLDSAPIKRGDNEFRNAFANFYEEVLSIYEVSKVSNKRIQENEIEQTIDMWQELTKFYFFNLIRKYSRGQLDPSDAKEVLENCIIKKYITNKKIKEKLCFIKDDEHMTKKFTSDLYYSTITFLEKQRKERIISIEKKDKNGGWFNEIDSPCEDAYAIESIDYKETDLSEMISKIIIKSTPFSNYLMWNFRRLENIQLDFENKQIKLPIKFNLHNTTVLRFYSHNTEKMELN